MIACTNYRTIVSQAQGLNPIVAEVFKLETAEILKGKSPADYNAEFLAAHTKCFKARFYGKNCLPPFTPLIQVSLTQYFPLAAQALFALDAANKQKALELVTSDVTSTDYPLHALLAAYDWIELHFTSTEVDAFKQTAHKAYPLIAAFAPPKEVAPAAAAPVDEGENPAEQRA